MDAQRGLAAHVVRGAGPRPFHKQSMATTSARGNFPETMLRLSQNRLRPPTRVLRRHVCVLWHRVLRQTDTHTDAAAAFAARWVPRPCGYAHRALRLRRVPGCASSAAQRGPGDVRHDDAASTTLVRRRARPDLVARTTRGDRPRLGRAGCPHRSRGAAAR